MKRLFLIVGTGLALVACATAQIRAGKSLIVAADAVAFAAQQAHMAYLDGTITKAGVKLADGYADESKTAVMTAQCAYSHGDLTTTDAAISEVTSLALVIVAIVKGTKLPPVAPVAALTCANPAPVASVVVPAK